MRLVVLRIVTGRTLNFTKFETDFLQIN